MEQRLQQPVHITRGPMVLQPHEPRQHFAVVCVGAVQVSSGLGVLRPSAASKQNATLEETVYNFGNYKFLVIAILKSTAICK